MLSPCFDIYIHFFFDNSFGCFILGKNLAEINPIIILQIIISNPKSNENLKAIIKTITTINSLQNILTNLSINSITLVVSLTNRLINSPTPSSSKAIADNSTFYYINHELLVLKILIINIWIRNL